MTIRGQVGYRWLNGKLVHWLVGSLVGWFDDQAP